MISKTLLPGKIIGKYPDREIYLGSNFFADFHLITQKFTNSLIITDEIIYEAFAKEYIENVSHKIHIAPAHIKPSKAYADELIQKLDKCDYAIAIGSGTINDLTKYAAAKANIPYIVFATAPSMNGYLSENASLISNNLKQSYKSAPPKYAYFDLDILCQAPIRLIQSGLGDSICSCLCRADWLLSHHLLNTHYDELPFELTYKLEEKLYHKTELLLARNKEAITLLTEIIILSSLGMTYIGSSQPASQGEHMLAHFYELLDQETSHLSFHGEQIAVTSQHMLELQEKFLNKKTLHLTTKTLPDLPNNISQAKVKIERDALIEMNSKLNKIWPALKKEINEKYHSKDKIHNILKKANLVTTPNELNWNKEIYKTTIEKSFLTRDRFTFLDLEFYSS